MSENSKLPAESESSKPKSPSTMREMLIGTVAAVVVALATDSVIAGAGVGIALGAALSAMKIVRAEKK